MSILASKFVHFDSVKDESIGSEILVV